MRRVLAMLVGTRPDLDLGSRWWHRLVIVAFVAFTLLVAVVVAVRQGGVNGLNLSHADRVVTKDLLSFVEGFRGSGDPAIAFNVDDGWLGVSTAADESRELDIWLALHSTQITCKSGGRVFCASGGPLDVVATERNGVQIEPMPNRPGDAPDPVRSACWGPGDLKDIPVSSIIRFKPTRIAVLTRWVRNSLIGGVIAGALALFLAVVYYRGVIYVAFGPKRSGV